jgi:hypothetical protein
MMTSAKRILLASSAIVMGIASVGASAQPASSIPDFSSGGVAWQQGNDGRLEGVPGFPGPMRDDPKYPFVPNGRGAQPTFRIADLTNPNLKQ